MGYTAVAPVAMETQPPQTKSDKNDQTVLTLMLVSEDNSPPAMEPRVNL